MVADDEGPTNLNRVKAYGMVEACTMAVMDLTARSVPRYRERRRDEMRGAHHFTEPAILEALHHGQGRAGAAPGRARLWGPCGRGSLSIPIPETPAPPEPERPELFGKVAEPEEPYRTSREAAFRPSELTIPADLDSVSCDSGIIRFWPDPGPNEVWRRALCPRRYDRCCVRRRRRRQHLRGRCTAHGDLLRTGSS